MNWNKTREKSTADGSSNIVKCTNYKLETHRVDDEISQNKRINITQEKPNKVKMKNTTIKKIIKQVVVMVS